MKRGVPSVAREGGGMQLDQVLAFVRCAELGSLSAAARAAGQPRSSLSRMLGALERELGAALLTRTSRGVTLTQEGRVLLGHARQILDDIDIARAAVRHAADTPSGTIRFTAPDTFGASFIAPLLPAFFRAYPLINLHVELASRNMDFGAEGCDVGIRIGPPPADLVARRIMGNPMMLCATRDHLDRFGTPATPDDLAGRPLLLIGNPRSANTLRLWQGEVAALVTTPPRLVSTDPPSAFVLRGSIAGAALG